MCYVLLYVVYVLCTTVLCVYTCSVCVIDILNVQPYQRVLDLWREMYIYVCVCNEWHMHARSRTPHMHARVRGRLFSEMRWKNAVRVLNVDNRELYEFLRSLKFKEKLLQLYLQPIYPI